MALAAGTRLGPYEILAPLGAGGMGEVYRAKDTKLGREVALKTLPPEVTGDSERLARFRREAHLLASLNHPNIAAIHGLEEEDGRPFLVLELVEGEELRERLQRGRLPVVEALPIAEQIARAFEEAHGKGIIHRDLKPANVKLTPDGQVKVLDFGLAKTYAPQEPNAGSALQTLSKDVTREGVILGTAAYMSPEQARGQDVDERTDIWSFGCVLWECLTGTQAFGGATVSDSIAAILHEEPSWHRLPGGTAPRLRQLLRRCLTKDRDRRLHHIADARIELQDSDPLLPVDTPAPRSSRIWFGVLGLVLGGLGAAALLSLRGATTDPPALGADNPLADARFTRVTSLEGSALGAAISPDGQFVAFVSDRDGSPDVFLGQIGVGEFRNVTEGRHPVEVRGPRTFLRQVGFTGDGSEIWLAGGPGPRRMRLVPLLGGPMRTFLGENVVHADWSPDGESLVYFEMPGDPIYVADRDGTDRRVIIPPGDVPHQHFPVWGIDGRWIYLVRGRSATSLEMDLWRVRSNGDELQQLTRGKLDVKFPTPLDARTVLYSARDGDGAGPWLWVVDVGTRTSRRASVGLEQYTSVAASADRRRLVATEQQTKARLWSVPILDRLATESDAAPYADLATERALAPRFAGSSLFYLSSRGSGDGLWRYEDGQVAEIWRGSETALLEPAAVSADGSSIVLLLRRDDGWHLHVLSADGAQLRMLTEAVEARGVASWSPDGQWVAAGGHDTEGPGLFRIPVDGGAHERIVDGVATDPTWSPDGSLIVYAGPQTRGPSSRLLAVRPDGRPVELPEISGRLIGAGARFLPDGSGLVYQTDSRTSVDLWLLDLTSMETRQLTRLDRTATTQAFDITPDGQRIVFDRSRTTANIVLIEMGDPEPPSAQ